MASLIEQNEKDDMTAAMLDVFDTFKREITVYKEPERIIISSNPNYSRFGDNSQNQFNPPVTPIASTIYACILHEKNQRWVYVDPNTSQIKVRSTEGKVRIKVDATGYEIMRGAKNITLDGFNYRTDSSPRPHGLFQPVLWTFFLERVE